MQTLQTLFLPETLALHASLPHPRHFWQILLSIPNSLVSKLALCFTLLNWV